MDLGVELEGERQELLQGSGGGLVAFTSFADSGPSTLSLLWATAWKLSTRSGSDR
ncbi:MAG TPA: hypothetical protein QGF35_01025 [Dehalococcoidia bacterium]|nr:hypothetical protein [Dehalococcoidia bacterium]